jgi:hypothetical protein
MDERTINQILINEKCFIGTFARDLLPYKVKGNKALIANTDPSSKPGEHWIAIIIKDDGTGDYFDSYGLPPMHKEFLQFLNKNCPNGWTYNSLTLQCFSCMTCGHYCIAYIKFRCNGYSYCDFVSHFSNNKYLNDDIVQNYLFNLN